jgi:muramidase (phage lysozyme)
MVLAKLRSTFFGVTCLAASLCCVSATSTQAANGQVLDRPFLELLGFIEGPSGYDQLSHFVTSRPMHPISTMTIDQVLDYQRQLRQQGAKSTAMGRYQFVYKTLLHLTKTHNIDRNRKFDSTMQDYLARLEMWRCGYYDPKMKVAKLGNCLAAVWAALPMLDGKERGRSRYEKMKINSAQTSPMIVEAILGNRFTSKPYSSRKAHAADVLKIGPAVSVSSAKFQPIMIPDTPMNSIGYQKSPHSPIFSTSGPDRHVEIGKNNLRSTNPQAVKTSLRPVSRPSKR